MEANDKEKALLDYMYGLSDNLIDFMERNGYDCRYIRVEINPGSVYTCYDGREIHYTSQRVGFRNEGNLVEKRYCPYDDKTKTTKYKVG